MTAGTTASAAEDPGGLDAWSIGDRRRSRAGTGGPAWSNDDAEPLRIRINAREAPAQPAPDPHRRRCREQPGNRRPGRFRSASCAARIRYIAVAEVRDGRPCRRLHPARHRPRHRRRRRRRRGPDRGHLRDGEHRVRTGPEAAHAGQPGLHPRACQIQLRRAAGRAAGRRHNLLPGDHQDRLRDLRRAGRRFGRRGRRRAGRMEHLQRRRYRVPPTRTDPHEPFPRPEDPRARERGRRAAAAAGGRARDRSGQPRAADVGSAGHREYGAGAGLRHRPAGGRIRAEVRADRGRQLRRQQRGHNRRPPVGVLGPAGPEAGRPGQPGDHRARNQRPSPRRPERSSTPGRPTM